MLAQADKPTVWDFTLKHCTNQTTNGKRSSPIAAHATLLRTCLKAVIASNCFRHCFQLCHTKLNFGGLDVDFVYNSHQQPFK